MADFPEPLLEEVDADERERRREEVERQAREQIHFKAHDRHLGQDDDQADVARVTPRATRENGLREDVGPRKAAAEPRDL